MATTAPIHSESDSEQVLDNWYLRSRHAFIAGLAERALAGRAPATCRILDAGCGSGGLSGLLLQKGYNVASCDMDNAAIQQGLARGRLRDARQADVTDLPFEDGAFDLVICSEVIEHVPDDEQALRSLLRVARRDVLISVPAHAYLWTDSDTILGHCRRYSRSGLADLVARSGAELIHLRACHFIPAAGTLVFKALPQRKSAASVPNAMRFRLPRVVDRILYALSAAELRTARAGLVPWGFAWWALLRKKG